MRQKIDQYQYQVIMTTTEIETNIEKIKLWLNDVFSWFNKVNLEIKKIDFTLNTYNDIDKNIDFINFIDNWINNILYLYSFIINDMLQIQIFLIEIKHENTQYINEYEEIIKLSVIFFNILLPIIKKTNNTDKNKKRKLDTDHDNKLKVTKYLDDKKYSKTNDISTFNDIINYLQTNNLCQKLTEKMQTRIERFLNFLIKQNQEGTICIKKLNDPNIKDTCLKFNTINIKNKDEWIKAIEYNIENNVLSANSIYEMLLMFGFSSQECKKEINPSFRILDKKVQILYSKESWIYNDKTFHNNIHRSWNSNIKSVDTIRVNKSQTKFIKGIDLLLEASKL